MGITSAILKVREHRKSEKFAEVNFLVDSGAVYSLVPGKILDQLDIDPYKEMSFSLADGTTLKRRVCSGYFEFEGEGGPAPVVYGKEGDEPLLGASTLLSWGKVLNPFTRKLDPMRIAQIRKKVLLTILWFVIGLTGFGQSTDEIKLTQTLKEFHQALVKKNTVSINQQTDKALTYGHSNGWVETKNEMIKNLETGYVGYQEFKEDSISISLNANVASARFIADIKATLNGKPSVYHLKVLEVWLKKGNRWVLFARQSTKID